MRRVVTVALAAGIAALAGLAVACGGSGGEARVIDVTLIEKADGTFAIEPAEVSVAKGEKVRFQVRNGGKSDHEFESDDAHIEEVLVPPGKTRSVSWTPKDAGDFEIYCDLPGHKAGGMLMRAVVR